MVRPIRPDIPSPPSRLNPDTFNDNAKNFFGSIGVFLGYLDGMADHLEEIARTTLSATMTRIRDEIDLGMPADLLGKAVGINAGGTEFTGVDPSNLTLATREQALMGTTGNFAMTSLRTGQALRDRLPRLSGKVKLSSLIASNSGTLTFETSARTDLGNTDKFTLAPSDSAFTDISFSDYELVISNLIPSVDGASIRLSPSDDAGTSITSHKLTGQSVWQSGPVDLAASVGTSGDESGLFGILRVHDFHEDRGAMFAFDGAFVNSFGAIERVSMSGLLQRPSMDSPLNELEFAPNSGNFLSGSITLYGLTRAAS